MSTSPTPDDFVPTQSPIQAQTRELLSVLIEIRDGLKALATPAPVPATPSLLVSAGELPALIGRSITKTRELRDHPRFPKPVAIEGEPMWRRADVVRWVESLGESSGRKYRRRQKTATADVTT